VSYKWGECSGCLSDGLLKRVAIYPGVLEVHRRSKAVVGVLENLA
jgi:hypothetical protein